MMTDRFITVFGNYAGNRPSYDGQTIKTGILTEALLEKYSDRVVKTVDTFGGISSIFRIAVEYTVALFRSQNVIFMPAQRGIKLFALLTHLLGHLCKCKTHYVVIGGWLPAMLKREKFFSSNVRRIDCIYVETESMKALLEEQGMHNVILMPNCKQLKLISLDEINTRSERPLPLCTFSRVIREKGIEDAVTAVKAVNERFGEVVFTLDIYGQVGNGQEEWFSFLQSSFPSYVSYKGAVAPDKSNLVLKDYFALLFPTVYDGEGIPGTVIDAFFAGLPVIASRWNYYSEIIDEGITGISYSFGNVNELIGLLENVAKDPDSMVSMKKSCLEKAEYYLPENVIDLFQI